MLLIFAASSHAKECASISKSSNQQEQTKQGRVYLPDLTVEQWVAIWPLITAARSDGPGHKREMREVVLADRLKSADGIQKLKRLLAAALPKEYRTAA